MKQLRKNIYCIEGLWNSKDLRVKSTIQPILELLEKCDYCNYIYHDCATKEEFEFLLSSWKTKKINEKYPILYLAFHGDEGCICLNQTCNYTLKQLSDYLGDKALGKVIYFGSCSTLNIDQRYINNFLESTGAIAVIGYKKEIDWIQSTACDLFVFEALQNDKLDSKGIKNIHEMIIKNYGNLHRTLELRVVINKQLHFPRRRKKLY